MLNCIEDIFELAVFNNVYNMFDATDFIVADHLNEKGAKKVSNYLVKKFGI